MKKRRGPIDTLIFLLVGVLTSCDSLGEKVKKGNDNYYYSLNGKKILYCPMGNWFELGQRDMPEGLDLASFKPLDDYYWAKDKNGYYYADKSLDYLGIDSNTFQILDIAFAKDANQVFVMNREDWTYGPKPILSVKGADPNTFVDEPSKSLWSKDAFNYFYKYHKAKVEYESFVELDDSFAKDDQFLYILPSHIIDSLGNISFEAIELQNSNIKKFNNEYIIDSNFLYHYSYNYRGETVNKVIKIPYNSRENITDLGHAFIKVDDKIYYDARELTEADAGSFEILESTFKRDKDALYVHSSRFEDVDFESLKKMDGEFGPYYEDASYIYHANGNRDSIQSTKP